MLIGLDVPLPLLSVLDLHVGVSLVPPNESRRYFWGSRLVFLGLNALLTDWPLLPAEHSPFVGFSEQFFCFQTAQYRVDALGQFTDSVALGGSNWDLTEALALLAF